MDVKKSTNGSLSVEVGEGSIVDVKKSEKGNVSVQVGENGCHAYRYDVMSGFALSHDKRFLTRAHS